MNYKSENDFYFESLQERYFRKLITSFENIVNIGVDKEYSKYWGAFGIGLINFNLQNPYIQDLVQTFKHVYKLGYSIDYVLKQVPTLQEKHINLMEQEELKNNKIQYHYKNRLFRLLKIPFLISSTTSRGAYIWNSDIVYETNNRKVIKILIKYFAVKRFFNDYFDKDFDTENLEDLFQRLLPAKQIKSEKSQISLDQQIKKRSNVKWTGKNKTEFIQLIYALYHSKLINNDTNEITKIVIDIASFFDVELGNNWQSNLSKSKNVRNNDYVPKVFDRIKTAYVNYSNKED